MMKIPRMSAIFLALVGLCWATDVIAQQLTPEQYATLRTDVTITHQAEFAQDVTNGNHSGIASAYNQLATPATFWVTKTRVTADDIYNRQSPTGSLFDWTVYKNQGQGERDAWREMFSNAQRSVNPNQANVVNAVNAIFAGAPAAAQRAHILAHFRRPALRAEQLFSTGTGGSVGADTNPATLLFEGKLTADDISIALALP